MEPLVEFDFVFDPVIDMASVAAAARQQMFDALEVPAELMQEAGNFSSAAANLALFNRLTGNDRVSTALRGADSNAVIIDDFEEPTENAPEFEAQTTQATVDTSWSTAGTEISPIGVTTPAGFSGNILDLRVNGTPHPYVSMSPIGEITIPGAEADEELERAIALVNARIQERRNGTATEPITFNADPSTAEPVVEREPDQRVIELD